LICGVIQLLESVDSGSVPHFESAARVVLSVHGTKEDENKLLAVYTKDFREQLAVEELFTATMLTPTGPYIIAGGRV
jgi:hypothetical protein